MRVAGKKISGRGRGLYARGVRLCLSLVVSSALMLGGCFREQKGERFYGQVVSGGAGVSLERRRACRRSRPGARGGPAGHGRGARALRGADDTSRDAAPAPRSPAVGRAEAGGAGRSTCARRALDERRPVTARTSCAPAQQLRLGESAPHATLLSTSRARDRSQGNRYGREGLRAEDEAAGSGVSEGGRGEGLGREAAPAEGVRRGRARYEKRARDAQTARHELPALVATRLPTRTRVSPRS